MKLQHVSRFRANAVAVAFALAGCQTQPMGIDEMAGRTNPSVSNNSSGLSPAMADAAARAQGNASPDSARIYKGTGVVVKGMQPGGKLPEGPAVQPAGGGVILNFEAADLREVIRNILGDILNENYTIDPAVGGSVTIRTSTSIPRDALTATLETLLRANGATMVKNGGMYQVVPQAVAVRGNTVPQLGNSTRALPSGFSVQIVPLRFVGVKEMMRLLEPFAKDAQAVRPDELRNLLILAGTERELKNLMDTIDMFDIDWMAGMSAGVFTLTNSDVKSVMAELDKIIGDRNLSPLAGILRVVPLERMNALLVITPQPAYLDEVKMWIDRLDRTGGGDGGGLQFYVYNLSNQRAEKLGPLLQQAFTGRASQPTSARDPHDCARHAGRHHRQPTDVHAGQSGDGQQHHADAADAAGRRPGRGHRHRHRAQSAGRRRQGQQHAARHRHGRRIFGDRGRAAQARRAATPGGDGSDDRRGHAHRRHPVRRRLAVPGRRALRQGFRRQHQQPAGRVRTIRTFLRSRPIRC